MMNSLPRILIKLMAIILRKNHLTTFRQPSDFKLLILLSL